MVGVVSAMVDEETRRRMRRLPQVNWSEVIREAIAKKIREEELRRDVDPREAAGISDSFRAPSEGWDSMEEIRSWRERR